MSTSRTLRIIGGKWRSRKLTFPDVKAIRPTPDRLRETLFNWLQLEVRNTKCLDLFAGSGALGLEALSRGARFTHFVDKNPNVISQIKNHLKALKCESGTVYTGNALDFLKENQQYFDIVFLDPPFSSNLLMQSVSALTKNMAIDNNSIIYVESKKNEFPISEKLRPFKSAKSGDVNIWLTKLCPR